MAISMLKIRRPLGRLIFNMGIAIPGKTVFLIETPPRIYSRYVWVASRGSLDRVRFYFWQSKILASERRRYVCNVFSHWLRSCSAVDKTSNAWYEIFHDALLRFSQIHNNNDILKIVSSATIVIISDNINIIFNNEIYCRM